MNCCVLFDPADGEIRHVHHVVTIEGAEVQAETTIEERARALAKGAGIEIVGLRTLHVDAAKLEPGEAYRVDLEKHRLVKRRVRGTK